MMRGIKNVSQTLKTKKYSVYIHSARSKQMDVLIMHYKQNEPNHRDFKIRTEILNIEILYKFVKA